MSYMLRRGLSFCRVGGCHIFLDLDADRYFRLPDSLEHRFTAYVEGQEDSGILELIDRNIVVSDPTGHEKIVPAKVDHPIRSAVEVSPRATLHVGSMIHVPALVLAVAWRLRMRSLADTVDWVAKYRSRMQPLLHRIRDHDAEHELLASSREFGLARSYVPVETRCLPDSLAMAVFLARRGFHATIVFGVTTDPFSAHCWVQFEDMVLNDTVGHANSHTAILAI